MTNYGICLQAIVPVRKSPGDKNEMINQLLFGELVHIKDAHENWLLIEGADDRYEGWADKKQLHRLTDETYNHLLSAQKFFLNEMTGRCISQTDQTDTHLVLGSQIWGLKNGEFELDGQKFTLQGSCHPARQKPEKKQLTETALKYLNAPYLWGGRSPFGIDCSGLTQIVFSICGYKLPRDASQQVTHGETIDFNHEAEPGDLAFFGNEEGEIIHVGIVLNDQKIIHASGKVRIDQLDHQGIYNVQDNRYSHNLRLIKRVL